LSILIHAGLFLLALHLFVVVSRRWTLRDLRLTPAFATSYGVACTRRYSDDPWLRCCAGHRTRGHCALSAMLTVSQLSKSFAGRALFDEVSLQVNRGDLVKFQS
jgi:hypothetical protein